MVILDNLGIHTSKGSRLLRALLAEVGEDLMLVYTPTYDPDPRGTRPCSMNSRKHLGVRTRICPDGLVGGAIPSLPTSDRLDLGLRP
jgi:hypothetical protein